MIYLSGKVNVKQFHPRLGYMVNFTAPVSPPSGSVYAIDNGCYRASVTFSLPAFLAFLDRWAETYGRGALFAVAPDVVGDASATLERWHESGHLIKGLGYRVAFVTQDGQGSATMPWHDLDAMFVGGSDMWKQSEESWDLVAAAQRRGKWVHMGRVNGWRRLRSCVVHHVDSVDGTFLAFGPDQNEQRMLKWLRMVDDQPPLFARAGQ